MQKSKKKKSRFLRLATLALSAAALLCAAMFVLSSCTEGLSGEADSTQPSEGQQAGGTGVINPLTGTDGFDESQLGKRPVAIMINNAPAARPQWGLCSPDIVFEGLVEGGASRMMWVYADINDIPKVGSVRSARHDFLEIAEGMDALFVHWGGSDLAYNAIKARNVDDIDGITYAETYFFRDKSRGVAIEHTGYTTGEALKKAVSKLERRTQAKSGYTSLFTFEKPDVPRMLSGGSANSVSFSFSSAGSYAHKFEYDAKDSLYYNYIGGAPMTQDGGKQMAVTNVLLLYCSVTSTGDSSGHMEMDLSGGSGVYLSNGTQEKITWKKGGPSRSLKLYGADGSELSLNAGKSYVGLVPTSRQSSVAIA